MRAVLRTASLLLVLLVLGFAGPAAAQEQYPPGELISTGHKFFGTVSRGLATVIEKAVSQWGLPNGYILGQEAGGAFVAGYVTARACSTPRMPATFGSTGKVRRSASISAARARAP